MFLNYRQKSVLLRSGLPSLKEAVAAKNAGFFYVFTKFYLFQAEASCVTKLEIVPNMASADTKVALSDTSARDNQANIAGSVREDVKK